RQGSAFRADVEKPALCRDFFGIASGRKEVAGVAPRLHGMTVLVLIPLVARGDTSRRRYTQQAGAASAVGSNPRKVIRPRPKDSRKRPEDEQNTAALQRAGTVERGASVV